MCNTDNSLFVCTTVGATRYLDEWLEGVKLLKPSIIAIARDLDRSEPLTPSEQYRVINYRTNKAWKGYELRHLNYESDYSIGLGIVKLMGFFLERNETHFIHIDSDVIITETCAKKVYPLTWDNLTIVTPVIPRDRINEPNIKPMWFWDSTNFGLRRDLLEKMFNDIKQILNDPHPIDIKIHNVIRLHKPNSYREIRKGVYHYIRGVKTPL